jgi:energy-coupling factor transport system ATP-binding protein
VIRFEQVGVTYPGAPEAALTAVDLQVDEGELCLVIGPTGAGKSTLLRCVNGLVPHFTGGRLSGRVTVAGRDTRTCPPRELADVVGYVGQDPLAGFVTDVVEDELAYGMESLGVPPAVMRRRVEETLDLLDLAELRHRPLLSLSAGQQQRVAIGSVLTVQPRVLVLDEPTSALDPPAAEQVLAALTRLVHDLGLTVLLAEHRLERVVQYADRVVLVRDRRVVDGPPRDVLAVSPVVPPVVELARFARWAPLPLSVREARRLAGPLKQRLLAASPAPSAGPAAGAGAGHSPAAVVRGLVAAYDGVPVLRGVDLTVGAGEVVALMGRNGAGKSTLLAAMAGLVRPAAGTVRLDAGDSGAGDRVGGRAGGGRVGSGRAGGGRAGGGRGESSRGGSGRAGGSRIGLVPQQPADLLWARSVAQECADADRDAHVAGGTTRALLRRLAPDVTDDTHPRDLSEGQRLALALAVVLAGAPTLLALDEPTRGLDYSAKRRLVGILRDLAAGGGDGPRRGVLLVTHDVELVAEVADRLVVLADGEVVSDGPAREVAVSSPVFAPQVAKVLAPLPLLTVGDVQLAAAG